MFKMNVEEQMYKMCTKCFDTFPFKMFHNCLRNYDGKTSWCKQCKNKAAKANNIKNKLQIQDTLKHFNELPFKL